MCIFIHFIYTRFFCAKSFDFWNIMSIIESIKNTEILAYVDVGFVR